MVAPKGRKEGGVWGTTTFVGALTWSLAIAAIPSIVGPFIILLFCPLDKRDVYNIDGNLYLASGEFYKSLTEHNFEVRKSEHIAGVPKGAKEGGSWGTTTFVGAMTWAVALAAIPTIVGPFIILLFCPMDSREVYNVDGKLYLASGEFYKSTSDHNFDVRHSIHIGGTPKGRSEGGAWGTTTYVGPMTWSFAIAAIPSIVGPFIILLFCPLDQCDVYSADGSLYLANGEFYKSLSDNNFLLRKSEHAEGAPKGAKEGGIWGTTTFVGATTWSAALAAVPTIVGPFIILLFCPVDQFEVYNVDGKLLLASGEFYKSTSSHNFELRNSAHVVEGPPEAATDGDVPAPTSTKSEEIDV